MDIITRKAVTSTRQILNKTGLRNAEKVFAVGFNKTGTTSIHTLFKKLGLPSYHGENWRSCDNLRLLDSYDCFSDGIPEDLPKLDKMYPGSKFILQVRNLDSWVYSRLAHIERNKEKNIQIDRSKDWDNTHFAIKSWIKQRNVHHLSVLSYFTDRPSDLLVVNFIRDKSAAEKIATFLGYEADFQKPKKNVRPTKEPALRHKKMLQKCISDLKIPEEELNYDIYCPSLPATKEAKKIPPDTSML